MRAFTKHEEELMDFLWEYGEPVTSKDILSLMEHRTWSDNYVHVMLRSLEKMGAIRCCGMVLYGTKYARQFCTAITREEYFTQLALENGVNTVSFAKVALGIVKQEAPDAHEELIRELEEIIREYREQGEKK